MRRCLAVALIAAVFLGLYGFLSSAHQSGVRFDSKIAMSHESALFGGFSGVEITPDGASLVAISDRGTLFSGDILRNAEGQLERINWRTEAPLEARSGEPLPRKQRDSEGLVLADDGTVFLSFEGVHRVAHYALTGDLVSPLPSHVDFENLQGNSGLEALAMTPEGQLLAIPERSGAMSRPFPIYLFDGQSWQQSGAVSRRGMFLPVGADFGPDGALYLLERDYFFSGFRSRVRRFDWKNGQLGDEKELLVTRFWQRDNLEGISVWQAPDGQLRMTLISDDNFNALQVNELVEYVFTSP